MATGQHTIRSLVVGLGNPLLGDDAVGWLIAQEVERRLLATGSDPSIPPAKLVPHAPPTVSVPLPTPTGLVEVDCASLGGLSLMERLVGYDRVIIIDSVVTGADPPGHVACRPLDAISDLSAGHLAAAHDTSLQTAIATGRRMGASLPDSVTVVTVEAVRTRDFIEELTPSVAAAVPLAAERVLELLREPAEVWPTECSVSS